MVAVQREIQVTSKVYDLSGLTQEEILEIKDALEYYRGECLHADLDTIDGILPELGAVLDG